MNDAIQLQFHLAAPVQGPVLFMLAHCHTVTAYWDT